MQTAFTLPFITQARVVISLVQKRDIDTQSCPPYLTIKPPCGRYLLITACIVLCGGDDVVNIGYKLHGQEVNIESQLRTYVLFKACGRQDGAGVVVPSHAMKQPNAGDVLGAAIAVTVVRPGVDVLGDVEDDATRLRPSQPFMSLQDSGEKTGDRVDVLETAVGHVLIYSYHSNVPQFCWILYLAVALTRSIVRFRATNLQASSKESFAFNQLQGRGGQGFLRNVTVCRKTRQSCRDRFLVVTAMAVYVSWKGLMGAAST